MKKRQTPFIPISILVVLVGVVAAMNYRPDPSKPPAPPAPEAVGESRESKVDAKGLKAAATGNLKASTPPRNLPRPGMGPGDEAMGPPSIEVPKMTITRPQPNDSQIAGQWYSDQAMKEIPKTK
jgi:hypothetical protein